MSGATVVDLWTIDVDQIPRPGADALASLLSGDEQVRAARLRHQHDRRRSRLRRGALRSVLGAYLCIPPGTVKLAVGQGGRPRVSGVDLSFSVSHSDGMTLIAVTERTRVGVDLERLRPLPERQGMSELVCAERERIGLSSVPAGERDRAFLMLWTVKEAVLKALGVGLAADPRMVVVAPGHPAVEARYGDHQLSGWTVRADSHPARRDALTALAVAAPDVTTNWRRALTFTEGTDLRI